MFRASFIIFAFAASAATARADICVACNGPAAAYDCTVKKADQIEGLAGAKAVNKICLKVLKRSGQHSSCEIVEAAACPGTPKTIGWKEVKEALASADDSEPAAKSPPVKAAAKSPPAANATGSNPAPGPKQPEALPKNAAGPPAPPEPEEPTIAGNIKGAAEKTWTCLTSMFGKC